MIDQPGGQNQSPKDNEAADKVFLTTDSSLQSQKEQEDTQKDSYYEVDEKKLVATNIGDGTSHDEGLAGIDDNSDEEEQ